MVIPAKFLKMQNLLGYLFYIGRPNQEIVEVIFKQEKLGLGFWHMARIILQKSKRKAFLLHNMQCYEFYTYILPMLLDMVI